MIRLVGLRITGFMSAGRVANIEFSSSNISVVYGENGCGKTTLLKILYGVLSQNSEILLSENVESVSIEFMDEGDNWQIVEISRFVNDDEYDWSDFLASSLAKTTSIFFGVERGITKQSINLDSSEFIKIFKQSKYSSIFRNDADAELLSEGISSYLKKKQSVNTRRFRSKDKFELDHVFLKSIDTSNIEEMLLDRYKQVRMITIEKIQSALFDTLSYAISLDGPSSKVAGGLPDNFIEILKSNRNRIILALDYGSENTFKTKILEVLEEIDNGENFEAILNNPLLVQLFKNIIDKFEEERIGLKSINLLIDTFNNFMGFGKKIVINDDEIFVNLNDGESSHDINKLSSGEKHILTFLAIIMIQGSKRNFIFIDEPEISLNVKWQRVLLELFGQLVPSAQIIVASHSPAIAKRAPHYLSKLSVS